MNPSIPLWSQVYLVGGNRSGSYKTVTLSWETDRILSMCPPSSGVVMSMVADPSLFFIEVFDSDGLVLTTVYS